MGVGFAGVAAEQLGSASGPMDFAVAFVGAEEAQHTHFSGNDRAWMSRHIWLMENQEFSELWVSWALMLRPMQFRLPAL